MDRVYIDVRSRKEFNDNPVCSFNIPIINKKEYDRLKGSFKIMAPFIVLGGLKKRHRVIKNALLKVSLNGHRPIMLVCNKGILRSPIMTLYAKYLGLNAQYLKGGIKNTLKSDITSKEIRHYEEQTIPICSNIKTN